MDIKEKRSQMQHYNNKNESYKLQMINILQRRLLRAVNLANIYIYITRENLFHSYSPRGKSFQTGIVLVKRCQD